MENFGTIFIEKNICFKTTNNVSKYSIDHSYKTGRPVLVFCEDDEYMYYLTIHSYHGTIQDSDYRLNYNCINKESYINVNDIYRKRICFVNEREKVDYKEMLNILKFFLIYQTTVRRDELFDTVLPLLNNQIEEILKDNPDLHFNIQ